MEYSILPPGSTLKESNVVFSLETLSRILLLLLLPVITGIAIYRKERSFRGRNVPSAEGRFLYGRKILNEVFSKISL